jgi:hypothetical protein
MTDRADDVLDQGPFGIEQDEGWRTALAPLPTVEPARNPGLGLVGYAWEEAGPSLAAREGRESLERHVEKLAALPFVDVLYIRCDWRDVQRRPGRLDFSPVWPLVRAAAAARGLRIAFRVMMSNTVGQPDRLAIPDFLQERVPCPVIGRMPGRAGGSGASAPGSGDPDSGIVFREPAYGHPAFQAAFRELNELLAAEFDGDPLVEFADLMMYGFWGEGHTHTFAPPFPDAATARDTFLAMTVVQLAAWKRVPLAVNTQPDISGAGNREVQELAAAAGCWLRTDSVLVEEPVQIGAIADRPATVAAVVEDGYHRRYDLETPAAEALERTMGHALDMGANYWSLWTESDALAAWQARRPEAIARMRARLGYRVRPAWVWQRKRGGGTEIIVAVANDGVAGVPGMLRLAAEAPDGRLLRAGSLDPGHPHPGRLCLASLPLPAGAWAAVRLRAEIELKAGVRRAVRWACPEAAADGSIEVPLVPPGDPSFRKGV